MRPSLFEVLVFEVLVFAVLIIHGLEYRKWYARLEIYQERNPCEKRGKPVPSEVSHAVVVVVHLLFRLNPDGATAVGSHV